MLMTLLSSLFNIYITFPIFQPYTDVVMLISLYIPIPYQNYWTSTVTRFWYYSTQMYVTICVSTSLTKKICVLLLLPYYSSIVSITNFLYFFYKSCHVKIMTWIYKQMVCNVITYLEHRYDMTCWRRPRLTYE